MQQDFFTGAVVTKSATDYSVVYKEQIVANYAMYESALMLALDRLQLEKLHKSNENTPKNQAFTAP
jgi:hypothetical protein